MLTVVFEITIFLILSGNIKIIDIICHKETTMVDDSIVVPPGEQGNIFEKTYYAIWWTNVNHFVYKRLVPFV